MSALRQTVRSSPGRSGAVLAFRLAQFQYGRSPAYRRIATSRPLHNSRLITAHNSSDRFQAQSAVHTSINPPTPTSIVNLSLRQIPACTRTFQSYASLKQKDEPPKEDVKDPPRQGDAAGPERPEPGSEQTSRSESEERDGSEHKESESESGKKEKDAPPPPPHGDKSPWQVFTDTLRSEFKASKEWNESTKALGSAAHDFTQNETLQRVRKGYGAASDVASSTTSKAFKTTGKAIGQSAAWTWNTLPVKGVRASVNALGRGIEKTTRPIRETDAYKQVRDVIDDGSSARYGGWVEKDQRKKIREQREIKEAAQGGRPRRVEKMEEDPDAGTNVTVHKDAAWKESWRTFRDSSSFMQGFSTLKNTYNESENPLISTARSITDRVAGFFAENETAMVIKKFREMDPTFRIEPFLQDMREYVLPEVLDAYVKGDVETLKLWLSAAQFQVYSALMHQYTTAGLKSDGKILDIRHVDILNARLLEPGEIPVFIITCRTQEVHVFRNKKTNQLAAGMEDRVQQVTYAIGVTRIPEDVNNPETRGWRLIELQKSGRDYI